MSQDLTSFSHIAVLGAGAWGTALALATFGAGRKTTLWVREDDVLASLKAGKENRFLPGVTLPKELAVTGDLAEACKADALLLVVPAQVMRGFADALKPHLRPGQPLVICTKGIEKNSGKLVTEVAAEVLPGVAPAILSGPSFARDVALGLPTAVTIAAQNGLAERLQAALGSPAFRPYASDDLIGVALGGAAKNVYAIACGVVEGMALGENARAALLARSFAERSRAIDLLYVNNEQEGVLEASRGFNRIFLGQVPRSRQDAIADHRILANQPDGEYASANYEDCSIWRWVERSAG